VIKKCQKCGHHLSLSKFSKNKQKRDGLQSWCRDCTNHASRRNYGQRHNTMTNKGKRCRMCGQFKSWSKFGKNKTKRDGLQQWCRDCRKENYTSSNRKRYYKRHRIRDLLIKYNLSEREYNDLVQRANGHCEICGNSVERLNIDHCHSTLKVRGLLCMLCNSGLGCFRDNIETLNNAITYLEKECS